MVATGAQRHKYSIGRWESRCGCTHSPLDTRTQTQLPACKYTLHIYTHTHINCATHSFAVLEQSDRIGGRMWASEFARFQVILVTLNPPRHIHHTHTNPRVHAHPSAPSLHMHHGTSGSDRARGQLDRGYSANGESSLADRAGGTRKCEHPHKHTNMHTEEFDPHTCARTYRLAFAETTPTKKVVTFSPRSGL